MTHVNIRTTRVFTSPPCPVCMAVLSGAHSLVDAAPSPGDATVCGYCISVLRFTDSLGLELMPESELSAWPREDRLNLETMVGIARTAREKMKREGALP